eukprot:SAG11_NODE_666_length_7841_cov_24.388272_8_plen_333_part_00
MSSRRKVRPGAPGSSQRSRPASAASGRSAVSAASALRARPTSATELRSGGSGSTGRGPCDRFAQPTLSSRQKENAVPQLHALEAGSQSMPVVRRRSERVRPRPARPNSKQFNLSGSGWELTEAGRRYSKESNLRHALGGWNAVPKHKTTASLWEHRWVSTLPDPSFDVDGDGIVSNEDLLVANEFDKDGNGTLDAHEKRELRCASNRVSIPVYRYPLVTPSWSDRVISCRGSNGKSPSDDFIYFLAWRSLNKYDWRRCTIPQAAASKERRGGVLQPATWPASRQDLKAAEQVTSARDTARDGTGGEHRCDGAIVWLAANVYVHHWAPLLHHY